MAAQLTSSDDWLPPVDHIERLLHGGAPARPASTSIGENDPLKGFVNNAAEPLVRHRTPDTQMNNPHRRIRQTPDTSRSTP